MNVYLLLLIIYDKQFHNISSLRNKYSILFIPLEKKAHNVPVGINVISHVYHKINETYQLNNMRMGIKLFFTVNGH